jgi:hypothetical protein
MLRCSDGHSQGEMVEYNTISARLISRIVASPNKSQVGDVALATNPTAKSHLQWSQDDDILPSLLTRSKPFQ